jgi:hypothetical protein
MDTVIVSMMAVTMATPTDVVKVTLTPMMRSLNRAHTTAPFVMNLVEVDCIVTPTLKKAKTYISMTRQPQSGHRLPDMVLYVSRLL